MTFAPRTWVVGEVVTAAELNSEIRDQFNSFFAAWTIYVPTWTAATTNPVVNNGTLTGRYMKVGRTVTVHANLITGSTTTYGSGNYAFALPAASANSGCTYIGGAHLLGTDRWNGAWIISPNVSTASPALSSSATNPRAALMTNTSPETLASGAQLRMTAVYEAAA